MRAAKPIACPECVSILYGEVRAFLCSVVSSDRSEADDEAVADHARIAASEVGHIHPVRLVKRHKVEIVRGADATNQSSWTDSKTHAQQ